MFTLRIIFQLVTMKLYRAIYTEINECNNSPCVHGTCDDKKATFSCTCDFLFGGIRCDEGKSIFVHVHLFNILFKSK